MRLHLLEHSLLALPPVPLCRVHQTPLIWDLVGVPHCPTCRHAAHAQETEAVARLLGQLESGELAEFD